MFPKSLLSAAGPVRTFLHRCSLNVMISGDLQLLGTFLLFMMIVRYSLLTSESSTETRKRADCTFRPCFQLEERWPTV